MGAWALSEAEKRIARTRNMRFIGALYINGTNPSPRRELSGGPPGQEDEKDLHRNAQPKGRDRTPAKSYSSSGCMNVRGQDCDEKKNQRDARGAPRRGDHKTNRAGDLAKPGKENHPSRSRNPPRRHANEAFLHGREMRARVEQ